MEWQVSHLLHSGCFQNIFAQRGCPGTHCLFVVFCSVNIILSAKNELFVTACLSAPGAARSTHTPYQDGLDSISMLKRSRNDLLPWMQRNSFLTLLDSCASIQIEKWPPMPPKYNNYVFQCCLYWYIHILLHYYSFLLHGQWSHHECSWPKFGGNSMQVVMANWRVRLWVDEKE